MSSDNSCDFKHYKKIFPYGRWNNSTTNYKLYRRTLCISPSGNIIVKQTKNLFKNTALQMSQKQLYSFLIRNGLGPNTR